MKHIYTFLPRNLKFTDLFIYFFWRTTKALNLSLLDFYFIKHNPITGLQPAVFHYAIEFVHISEVNLKHSCRMFFLYIFYGYFAGYFSISRHEHCVFKTLCQVKNSGVSFSCAPFSCFWKQWHILFDRLLTHSVLSTFGKCGLARQAASSTSIL